MLVSLWSAKGGAGVSVTAALLALRAGRRDPQGVLLVDIGGDQPLILGAPPSSSAGLSDWLAGSRRSPSGLTAAAGTVAPGLELLHRGSRPWPGSETVDDAVGVLSEHPATVIVDAGNLLGGDPGADVGARFAAAATRSILVTRPCYLAVARARDAPVVPSAIVLLREPDRALTAVDVESAIGAPVVASIDVDPAVARAVDAGLLAGRSPRGLDRALDAVA